MGREIDGGLWRGMRKKEERGKLGAAEDARHVHRRDNIRIHPPSYIFPPSRHLHARALVRVVCTRAFSGTHISRSGE